MTDAPEILSPSPTGVPVGNRRSRPPRGTAATPRVAHSVGQSCVRSMRMRPKGSGRSGCRAARRQPRSNGSRSAKADRSDALCTGRSWADAKGAEHPSSHHSDHSTPIDRRHERADCSGDALMQAATRLSPRPRNELVPPFATDQGIGRHPRRRTAVGTRQPSRPRRYPTPRLRH